MPANNEIYSVTEIQHDKIRRYNPVYLGHGAEHVVYEITSHPEIVAKVSWNKQENKYCSRRYVRRIIY